MPDTEHAGGFLARWSERKLLARKGKTPPADAGEVKEPVTEPTQAVEPAPPPAGESAREPVLTDADMPPLESLDSTSDYSGFLSPGVSATLRRQALARFFHSPHLNATDGLDDFAEDYTRFHPLGDLITADRRHQLDRAARLLLGQTSEEGPTAGTGPSRPSGEPLPSGGTRLGAELPAASGSGPADPEDTSSVANPTPPSPEQTA